VFHSYSAAGPLNKKYRYYKKGNNYVWDVEAVEQASLTVAKVMVVAVQVVVTV